MNNNVLCDGIISTSEIYDDIIDHIIHLYLTFVDRLTPHARKVEQIIDQLAHSFGIIQYCINEFF